MADPGGDEVGDPPAEIAALVAELGRLGTEAHEIADPLDENSFNWQPEAGAVWSIGQCLDHLVRTNRLYLEALEAGMRRACRQNRRRRGALEPGRLGRWFIGLLEPPVRRRFPAPARAVPASNCPKATTLAAFDREQERALAFAGSAAWYDCNSVRFRNPFLKGLPVFNLAAGIAIVAAHERRHLLQARTILDRPGFPLTAS